MAAPLQIIRRQGTNENLVSILQKRDIFPGDGGSSFPLAAKIGIVVGVFFVLATLSAIFRRRRYIQQRNLVIVDNRQSQAFSNTTRWSVPPPAPVHHHHHHHHHHSTLEMNVESTHLHIPVVPTSSPPSYYSGP
ncbi:hypothetical protein M422DRAFT_25668 [Sphaerobolus stellatus SS14]|nr:hypothetical protein M422DRAFT_25668 [Sphaerobolus stellatus SS14]